MERIRNDYCWNTVKDWQQAQKMGFAKIQDFLDDNSGDNLRTLIELTLNNCCPLQFVCVKTIDEKYIMMDSLMREFLKFINNEIPLSFSDERKKYFEELSKEEQSKILEAEVNSVWIYQAEP